MKPGINYKEKVSNVLKSKLKINNVTWDQLQGKGM